MYIDVNTGNELRDGDSINPNSRIIIKRVPNEINQEIVVQ